uniref:Uncharacterized protein n=1 Tax=Arundo donax TaxID=35708 RepID=A0A0A9B532_ARUDO
MPLFAPVTTATVSLDHHALAGGDSLDTDE